MVGPEGPLSVLFGSSIVQLSYNNGDWGRYSLRYLRPGYYGWNSRRVVQILDQVFPKDATVQPSLVIVYFGGNDSMRPHSSGLGPHVPLPEYIENMRKITIYLKNLSDKTRIIFLNCPSVNEAKLHENTRLLIWTFFQNSSYFSELVRTNELCRIYSEACKELCEEIDVKVVDLWTAIQKQEDWMNACFTDETQERKVVVEEILKVLKQAEWEPSLHWKSMPTKFSEDSLMI